MNCEQVQQSLSAWLDRECEEQEREALEAHLQQCAACRGFAESMQAQDHQLREALADDSAAARRITEQVVSKLAVEGAEPLPSLAARWPLREWFMLAWAAAAGFLLAIWLFAPRPGQQSTRPTTVQAPPSNESRAPNESRSPDPTATIAQVVASTGQLEVYDPNRSTWTAVNNDLPAFVCPSGRVRTADNAVCELKTNEGCVIRLNDQTEITLAGSSTIDLQRGQLWCEAPQEVALEVRLSGAPGQPSPPSTVLSKGPSKVVTQIRDQGQVQVVNASGWAQLKCEDVEQPLQPGEMAEIIGGKLQTQPATLLHDRWIHPLLVQKGLGNAELEQRVNDMLAQIGRTKIEILYEQEIRALGEHGVLPLVRYLRSPLSHEQGNRHAAMRLASDLAPVWLIPDFIELLKDDEPEIRVRAAQTLERLTGLNMDRPSDQWRGDPAELAPTVDRWGAWWQTHRHQFPSPTVRFTN